MKAIVDKDLCIGCELCVSLCPEVYAMEDDGKAEARVAPIPAEHEAASRDAAEQCPVTAIQIEE